MHIFHPDNGHFLCPYNPHLGPTIQWLHYRVNWVDIYERVSKRHSFFFYTVCCKSFQKKLQWENYDWDQASSSVLPSQSFVFTTSPTSFTRIYTLTCQRSLFMRRNWMNTLKFRRFSYKNVQEFFIGKRMYNARLKGWKGHKGKDLINVKKYWIFNC